MTAAVTVPLAGLGFAAVKSAGELEQASIAFNTMLGSAEAAAEHLQKLRDFAVSTPFQFPDLVEASKRLQAMGFAAAEVIPMLSSIGNAVAALGSGAAGIDRITLALGQMQAKGRVMTQEMNQLTEAGIPAWQLLADTLEVDVATAMKMVEDRAVSASVAIPGILQGMNEQYGGLMEQYSTTTLGHIEKLKESATFALQDFGKTLLPIANTAMEGFIEPVLEGLKGLATAFSNLSPQTQQLAIGLAAVAAAIGPASWAIGGIANGAASLVSLASRLPALLNPVTLAVAALGTAALIADQHLSSMRDQYKDISSTFDKYIDGLVRMEKDFTYAHSQLDKAREAGALSAQQYAQALAVLQDREKKSFGEEARRMMEDYGIKLSVTIPGAAKSTIDSVTEVADSMEDSIPVTERATETYKGLAGTLQDIAKSNAAKALEEEWLDIFRAAEDFRENGPVQLITEIPPTITDSTTKINEDIKSIVDVLPDMPPPLEDAAEKTDNVKTGMSALDREVRRVMDNLARSMSEGIWRARDLGDAFKTMARSIAEAITEYAIKQGVALLINSLDGALEKLGSLGSALSNWAGGVSGAAGGAASGAGKAAGGAASGAGGAAGGGGSAAGGVGGGIMGAIGAIGSIGGMVSGVIGNFQNAAMNKTLDLIEEQARYSQIHLLAILDKLNLHLPGIDMLHQGFYDHHMPAMAAAIWELEQIKDQGLQRSGVSIEIRDNTFGSDYGPEDVAREIAVQLRLQGVTS